MPPFLSANLVSLSTVSLGELAPSLVRCRKAPLWPDRTDPASVQYSKLGRGCEEREEEVEEEGEEEGEEGGEEEWKEE